MSLFRNVTLVSLLAVSSLVACKKDENKTGGAAGSNAKPGEVVKPTAEKQTVPTAAGDDFSYLPSFSDVVIQVDVARFRNSALFKLVEPKMKSAVESDAKFKSFVERCGMNPVNEVKSVAMGLKMDDEEKPEGIIVIHGLDKAKSEACIEKNPDDAKMVKDGDIWMSTKDDEQKGALKFIDNDTALMALSKTDPKALLMAAAKGEGSVKSSAAFMDLFNKTKTGSLRFLVNGNMKKLQESAGQIGSVKAVFGTIDTATGVEADLWVRQGSAEEAAKTVAMGNSQLAQIKGFVSKAELKADGADVRAILELSTEQLKSLMALAGM